MTLLWVRDDGAGLGLWLDRRQPGSNISVNIPDRWIFVKNAMLNQKAGRL
jgi:hypothetical protein